MSRQPVGNPDNGVTVDLDNGRFYHKDLSRSFNTYGEAADAAKKNSQAKRSVARLRLSAKSLMLGSWAASFEAVEVTGVHRKTGRLLLKGGKNSQGPEMGRVTLFEDTPDNRSAINKVGELYKAYDDAKKQLVRLGSTVSARRYMNSDVDHEKAVRDLAEAMSWAVLKE